MPRLTSAKPIPGHEPTTFDIDDPDFDPLDFEIDFSKAVRRRPSESIFDVCERAKRVARGEEDSEQNPSAG